LGSRWTAKGKFFGKRWIFPACPSIRSGEWKLLADHMAERVRRRAVQAVALAANVNLSVSSAEGYLDAVIVNIEEESGYAVEVTVPYKILGGQLRNLLPRRIVVGKVQMENAVGRFFAGRAS
jgi:hypothetical protein